MSIEASVSLMLKIFVSMYQYLFATWRGDFERFEATMRNEKEALARLAAASLLAGLGVQSKAQCSASVCNRAFRAHA